MIVFAVCDDDIAFAELLTRNLRKLLLNIPDELECSVKAFFSSKQILDYIQNNQINILLLDIDMPKVSGFQLAEILKKRSPDTIIIFVSAYDSFVYDSFQFNPFCFLRKNHLKVELPATIQKVLHKYLDNNITRLFKTTEGNINIRIQDIIYIESVKNYYRVHCKSNSVYTCRGTLSSIEKELPDAYFHKIHPAFIINMDNISIVGSNRTVILIDGTTLTVSIRKWSSFHSSYMEYTRKKVTLL